MDAFGSMNRSSRQFFEAWVPMKLHNCKSEIEQTAWAVGHLKKGGRIHEIALWLGGVDRPMRIVAKAKLLLRAEGRTVTKAMERVRDVEGQDHDVLAWRLANEKGQASVPS